MPLLEAQQLSKVFDQETSQITALKAADLRLQQGEALVILGNSGSGKSTLLHILGTLDQPSGGQLLIDGENPFKLNSNLLAKFRRSKIGFIFQHHHLLPQCTVLENVMIPAVPDKPGKDVIDRATQLLERVGLKERLNHRPAELSGGERQRVAVARALLLKPSIVLADEPTGSLDQTNSESIGQLLLDVCKENNTVLVCVTHSQDLARKFSKQARMVDGVLTSA